MAFKLFKTDHIVRILFLLILVSLIVATTFVVGNTQKKQGDSAFAGSSEISLEPYCKDGFYKIPTESKVCSRAPNCGGYSYDQLDTDDWRFKMSGGSNSHNVCMGEGADRASGGCAGSVPLCCYEVARTGDFTKCIGYWERLWCAKSQCDEARSKGASDSQCGGSCDCSSAHTSYCGEGSFPVPIAQRLGITVPTSTPIPQQPTNTVAPQIPTNTPVPQRPTNTPVPQPTTNNQQPTTIIQHPTSIVYSPTSNIQQPTSIIYNPTSIVQQPTLPPIVVKSPKEVLQEVINPESVNKLTIATERPLNAPKKVLNSVINLDKKLEAVVENWIFESRIFLLNLTQ